MLIKNGKRSWSNDGPRQLSQSQALFTKALVRVLPNPPLRLGDVIWENDTHVITGVSHPTFREA